MFSNEDQEAIANFVISSDNVSHALGIIGARDRIQKKIVCNFIKVLKSELKNTARGLGEGWRDGVHGQDEDGYPTQYWNVYLTKKSYKGLYRIALSAEKVGPKNLQLGVQHEFQKLRKQIDDGKIDSSRIKLALTETIENRKNSEWWPCFSFVGQYWDWTTLKVLHKLHNEGKSVASELAEQMRLIALATENVIDSICSGLPEGTLD